MLASVTWIKATDESLSSVNNGAPVRRLLDQSHCKSSPTQLLCPTGRNLAEVRLRLADLLFHPGRGRGLGTLLWGSRGPPSEEEESAAPGGCQGAKRAQLPICGLGAGPRRVGRWGHSCHRLVAPKAQDLWRKASLWLRPQACCGVRVAAYFSSKSHVQLCESITELFG